MVVLFVIIYGLLKKISIYDVFITGAKESFNIVFNMFPCLLAMNLAVNIFIASDFIDIFKFLTFIDKNILPLIIMRPISGTSSLAILTNIYKNFGPDSDIGLLASLIQGTTDTTLYILTLYFGSIGIKNTRYALIVGLIADFICVIVSMLFVKFL